MKEDEYDASVATLQSLATTLEADCVLLRQRKVDLGLTGQYLVRKRLDQQDFLEIRYQNNNAINIPLKNPLYAKYLPISLFSQTVFIIRSLFFSSKSQKKKKKQYNKNCLEGINKMRSINKKLI